MINYSDGKLWGMAGAELEFISLRIESRQQEDGKWFKVAILRFTDHDVQVSPMPHVLIEGEFYEIECPCF